MSNEKNQSMKDISSQITKGIRLSVIELPGRIFKKRDVREEDVSKPQKEDSKEEPCKVYKRRWLILGLFCLYSISNLLQFVLYSVIADILVDFYGISYTVAEWSSLISIVGYIIVAVPGTYLLDKVGLRWSVIIGVIGTCFGSWIKVASVHPSRYWVLLLGQGISQSFQVLIVPLPPKIAGVWFGSNEVAKACSIGVIGIMISFFFGYLIPPLLVQRGSPEVVEQGLYTLAYFVAIFPTILLPFILIFFSDAPPKPPSIAQLNIQEKKASTRQFKDSLKALLTNKSFMLFLLIFGVTYGMEYPIGIILNEIVLKHHPDAADHIGYMGAVSTLFGLMGSYFFGYILDKYRSFKLTTIIAFSLHVLVLILFVSTLSFHVYFIYFTGSLIGFFGTAIITIAYEISVELTFPEPESTTGGLLNVMCQIIGLAFTYLYSYLFNNTTELVTNSIVSFILIATCLLFIFVKFDLRRQNVEKQIEKTDIDVVT